MRLSTIDSSEIPAFLLSRTSNMKFLALVVLVFAFLAAAVAYQTGSSAVTLVAVFSFICAMTTFLSRDISSFLKIFVGIFATELVIFGALYLVSAAGLWPSDLAEYSLPSSLPETVALFAILVYAVSHIPLVRRMMRITDRYFDAPDRSPTRIWPFPVFVALERRVSVAMIILLVLINQAQVGINVRLSFFSRDWFNAIQVKDQPTFWHQLFAVFMPWAFIFIASAVVEYVVQSTLVIKWRRWLTEFYVSHWLDDHTHYRMALAGQGNADNPDQRISEDISRFIDGGQVGYGIYSFTITLISQLTSLVSFAILLWTLSSDFTLPYTNIAVPGFLFWVALLYAAIGTAITHLIGWPLAGLSFARQRYEADFRFSLARMREYSEQIALLRGEGAEKVSLGHRFASIIKNYYEIVACRKRLTAFTAFYGQISPFIPYVVAAPFYFLGKIELGIMTQTARAFGTVNESLNFFVTYYVSLADFKSVLERLLSFDASIEKAEKLGRDNNGPRLAFGGTGMDLKDLRLDLPDGREIVAADGLHILAKEPLLVTGASGTGKSTLFRAISGIWPFGGGQIEIPKDARIMLLPQKPYIPMGTLRVAITYPATADQFDDAAVKEAIVAAGLGAFAGQLDVEDAWSQRLSGGEQQRLAIARALLARPDWLFLDEATAAMDEEMENRTYEVLREKLPDTTIVSIGHRSTLAQFHKRRLVMTPTASGAFTPRQLPQEAAE
jgi:vitamin B12/bleomycin/antimicrobial peptide transport system ATP-binding/permease protein